MKLKSIHIPSSVNSVGEGAFEDCELLSSVELPLFMMEIKSKTFSNCCTMKVIIIPESVNIIRYKAFEWCESLTQVLLLENSVKEIEGYAFITVSL